MTQGVPGIIARRRGGRDSLFSSVALLLHMDGSNGGTTFTDSSQYNHSVNVGSGATTTTAQKVFGTASMDNTGASNSAITVNDHAAFTIGSGEFLLEMFARFDDTGTTRYLFGQSDSGGANATCPFSLQRTSGDKIRAIAFVGSSIVADITSSSSVTSGVWYYIAFGREGTTFRLFIDAVSEGSTDPGAQTLNDSAFICGIGRLGGLITSTLDGQIDEVRYTVGDYRDVATIGIPTSPFPNA